MTMVGLGDQMYLVYLQTIKIKTPVEDVFLWNCPWLWVNMSKRYGEAEWFLWNQTLLFKLQMKKPSWNVFSDYKDVKAGLEALEGTLKLH